MPYSIRSGPSDFSFGTPFDVPRTGGRRSSLTAAAAVRTLFIELRQAESPSAPYTHCNMLKGLWTAVLLPCALLGACTEHDYEGNTERVGGPIPNFDAGIGDAGEEDVTVTDAAQEAEAAAPVAWCARSAGEPSAFAVMAVCRRCHQDPPLQFAPFPLLTWDDTQQPFGITGRLRHQRMFEVVRDDVMPFRFSTIAPPVEPLSPDDKATLLNWLAQGAQPLGGRDCEGQ